MISGEYSHSLDAKNRIMLPAKLREQLGVSVVLTKSVDACISLYPTESWKAYCEKLDALPNTETRRVRRFLFSAAFETEIDGQGRILIPGNLCTYATLTKEVTVIGVGDHVELWNPEQWQNENNAENGSELADTLIRLGF